MCKYESISTGGPDSGPDSNLEAGSENGLIFEPNRIAGNPVPAPHQGHESGAPAPRKAENFGRVSCLSATHPKSLHQRGVAGPMR
jgi:hypothetical protein